MNELDAWLSAIERFHLRDGAVGEVIEAVGVDIDDGISLLGKGRDEGPFGFGCTAGKRVAP